MLRILATGSCKVSVFGSSSRRATADCWEVCGFWQDKGWPRELTWWLLPEARGKGNASEASRGAIAHGYDVFGWDHVETYMDDDNEAARALVLRLGGIENRREKFVDGKDRTIYRLPRSA